MSDHHDFAKLPIWIRVLGEFFSGLTLLVLCALPAHGQANVTGQWQTLSTQMPINPVHVSLMHNGKVLIVTGSGYAGSDKTYVAGVWDPAADTVTTQPLNWDMFCNGMIELPDGRPFVLGGTLQYNPFYGLPRTSVYDPATGSFVDLQSMAHGRWYPTATTLSDGSVMVFSGQDENGFTNQTVEIYRVGSGWSEQYEAPFTPPLYPRMHLLPNGTVFYSGSTTGSAIFNPTTQTWTTDVANTNYSGTRTYGTSVLLPLTPANNYDPRVMIMGGGNPATATTEIIDMGASSPAWVYGPSMSQPRIEMDAVILPNGKVLAVNGSTNDEDSTSASYNADLYDPTSNTFSSAGANAYPRLYHSGALLLPDATVLDLGGNPNPPAYQPQMEIYSPAYLFNSDGTLATRPTITSVTPGVIGYGANFQIQTPNAANISSVVLVRPGSPTHAFDMDQRLVRLNFTVGNDVLNATAPPNGSIAPPGYYMLFILNSSGVPSLASFVQMSLAPMDQPPKGMITSPSSSVTIGVGQAVDFSGTGTASSGTITGYSWVFPGGSPSSSELANPGNVIYTTIGTYVASLTVTDSAGVNDPSPPTVAISVLPPFSLTPSPGTQTIPTGASTSYTVTLTPGTGFSGTVSFNVSGLPSGATATFSPSTLNTSGSTTMSVVTNGAPAGVYPLTITGTSGQLIEVANVTLALGVVATPVITPATGTYLSSVLMSITDPTSGTTIYYTTNGSTPTVTQSELYTGPVTLFASATVNAIAVASGFANSPVGSASYTIQSPASVGLVGWWKFDDGSGTTAADSSGNGDTMTLFNGVSWVAGESGGYAISANGTNQYGTVPAINLSGTSTITVAFWANRSYSTTVESVLLEDSTNYNSSTTGFGFFPDDTGCEGIAAAVHGNVGYSVNCYSQPTSGVWHHLAIIYDKTQAGSNQTALYIDGVLQTPTTLNLSTAQNTNSFGDNPIYLFSRAGSQFFNAGEVDDLRIYNQALTAAQIQQLYQAGSVSLVSIAVTPANPSIAKGATQQFIATGTYSNNSTQNVTSSVTWSSTSTSVATITSAGLATGAGTGSTTIMATSGSISGSTGLTVTPAVLESIAVTPANVSLNTGVTQQFTATGTYSDSSTQNLTSSVTWSSTSTSVATITGAGLATGADTGTTTIMATSGSVSGSTNLTVTAPLVSIAVTPASASIAKGATQQFTATGMFSGGGTLNITGSVVWSSTNTAVATISGTGLATGVTQGSTTIVATSGSISGMTGLTVTAPALVSIALTPANPTIVVGATQQFTATGTYSDSSTQNLTSTATWSSTNAAAGTITSGGLATGMASGSTTIQATSSSISGSTTLTVSAASLVGWWKFDDGSGTTAADSSGNGDTMTLFNGVSWVAGESGGYAISANGTNQYGTVPAINLSGTSTITVAFWANRSYSTTVESVLLEDSTNYNSSTTGFGFFPDDTGCRGIAAAVHGNVGYSVNCYSQPTSGVWHHLAIIYDKTQAGSNQTALYIDGVLQTPTSSPNTAQNTNSFGNNPIYLFSRAGSQFFNAGEVDDLRIYNQALTAAQIQQLYQAGSK